MRAKRNLGGRFTFAGTALTVNRMGYGAMQLAGQNGDKRVWGPPRDIPGAIAVLREAVASGVNHIDTSDFYGPHVTNQIIKQALHPIPTIWSSSPKSDRAATPMVPGFTHALDRRSSMPYTTICAISGSMRSRWSISGSVDSPLRKTNHLKSHSPRSLRTELSSSSCNSMRRKSSFHSRPACVPGGFHA
jgi:hypothetical protein